MPRTKRPTSKKEKTAEDDEAWKKLDRLVADQKNKIDLRVQMKCRDIELAFKILLGSISSDILNKTVGELKNELHLPNTKRNSTRCASRDDGPPSTASNSTSRTTGRRSRSADASARKPPQTVTKTVQRRRSKSVYKTPAYNKHRSDNYPAITPKVAPNTPLTLLRQPRVGEMVVSMSGSPVMVPSYNNMHPTEKANCNIMLEDGTMLSLQPKQLRASSAFIPFSLMDAGVLRQLKTLKDNLGMVVQLGEKAMHQ